MTQTEQLKRPQWKQVIDLLRTGPKLTRDFLIPPLAAEYRRALVEARRKLIPQGETIEARQVTRSSWEYRIVSVAPTLFEEGK